MPQGQGEVLNVPKDIKHADDGVIAGLWPGDIDCVEAVKGLFGTFWGVIGEYGGDGATGFACEVLEVGHLGCGVEFVDVVTQASILRGNVGVIILLSSAQFRR